MPAQCDSSPAQGLKAFCCAGALDSDDASAAGDLPPNVQSLKWAYSTRTIYGWGNAKQDQKATAGWLAALPVFEPHWQVSTPSLPLSADVLHCLTPGSKIICGSSQNEHVCLEALRPCE